MTAHLAPLAAGDVTWLPVGEDGDTLYAEGHLPKDWHTVARALLGSPEGIDGRYECLEWWEAYRAGKVEIVHGWECWAPPGEWYGGSYITWHQPQEDIEGWATLGEEVLADDVDEDAPYRDILHLSLDSWDDEAVRAACASALPSIVLIAPGEGWPWLARIINPVTVLVR